MSAAKADGGHNWCKNAGIFALKICKCNAALNLLMVY